ncbi:hypothetical protein MKJ01_17375 [Chryseobacterium sp. SSA4.19]|uniref:hypothetical protein n=1 Tax=Chryseobacterium sp. SSA4.19 TaxID=2919915 RepID=UPI001F4D478A|nr:hypothetical protein [Chryseobacterium sp. SSA4.19]MCJ8155533.1 hypothetical protein [Chryseobacterium sp. SSA4.19]
MKPKFYIVFAILSFCISFSQINPKDSLVKCHGILQDYLLNTIQNAYQNRINKPEGPELAFGCGTAAMQYVEELDCSTAKYILEKYSFILDEIKNLKRDIPNYSYLNVFWIEKIKENRFDCNENEMAQFEKWKSQRNHYNFSALIISNKIDNHNEYVQLTITFPKEVIIKQYQLSYSNRWNIKPL